MSSKDHLKCLDFFYGFIAVDSFIFLYSFALFFLPPYLYNYCNNKNKFLDLEQDEIDELKMKLHEMGRHEELTVNELQSLKSELIDLLSEKVCLI